MKTTMNTTKESNQKPQTGEIDPIVIIVGDRVMAPSTAVARKFNKKHKNILRAIRDLAFPDKYPDFNRLNFEPSTYIDERGKVQPLVNMTRDGFNLLAMGLTGEKVMEYKIEYIYAFNRMEAERAEHARTLPPPSGDSEETRRALEALSKALDALLSAQDQTSLSKALDALIASQEQGTAVKEVREKVRYLGHLSRTYLPQIARFKELAGQMEALTAVTAQIAAGREAQEARFVEAQEKIAYWLGSISESLDDQSKALDRIIRRQDGQTATVSMVYNAIKALPLSQGQTLYDLSPVIRILEGIQYGIQNRMMEVTHLTTRIKLLDEKIDNVARGVPPQGGITGFLERNLPKEQIGMPMITSILDNHNSPEAFLNACMEPQPGAAIQFKFLYRVYIAWAYERYRLPINQKTFKARLLVHSEARRISIEIINGVPHLVGMRFKPDVIDRGK